MLQATKPTCSAQQADSGKNKIKDTLCDLLAGILAACQQGPHTWELGCNAVRNARSDAGHMRQGMKPAVAVSVCHGVLHQQGPQGRGVLAPSKRVQPGLLAKDRAGTVSQSGMLQSLGPARPFDYSDDSAALVMPMQKKRQAKPTFVGVDCQ